MLALVELSSSLWISTAASDTNSAKQLHLSPTFCVFLLFGSSFVCTHKQLLMILFVHTVASATKRIEDAEISRGLSISLLEGNPRVFGDCGSEF